MGDRESRSQAAGQLGTQVALLVLTEPQTGADLRCASALFCRRFLAVSIGLSNLDCVMR